MKKERNNKKLFFVTPFFSWGLDLATELGSIYRPS